MTKMSVWERMRLFSLLLGERSCWIWPGRKLPRGYASIKMGKRDVYVHRVAYRLTKGPIPDGMTIDHLCGNPPCFNPGHLVVATQAANMLRGECPSAQNARMTHCLEGHPLEGSNLLPSYLKKGVRRCRECYNRWQNERYHRRKLIHSDIGQQGHSQTLLQK